MLSFRPHYGPGVDSTSNRNEYQEYLVQGKGGWCVGLTTLPPSCADCLEILGASNSCRPNGPSSFYSVLNFDTSTHQPISLKSILMLILHFCLELSSGSFPKVILYQTYNTFCTYVCHKFEVLVNYVFAF
jgi:hypothetical protein